MKRKILKKAAMYVLILLGIYLSVGYLLHAIIFPEKKPDVATFFNPGDEIISVVENVKQTVVKQENGYVYCSSYLEPFAPGPPEHIHTEFDETFEVTKGELSVMVNGEVKKLLPGQKLHIPKGTPHKPFNESAERVYLKGLVAFPEEFAFYLTQVYGLMDNDPKFGKSASTMLQMALINHSGFDSYMAGPPVFLQKLLGFVLTPATRLMGYKSYYPGYGINRNS